ncbi:hypothetical protein VWBp06 [Streptomyces phage VWB]|uniref:Uncharacterized protein n=1 Tax=Streptomyces phage VWB TaxID=10702 RepID=Q6VY83_9CAUD|nr:hypothetical protein VWBp06 [Streptomyces phage VWB]AAR29696.1 hypothetical protein [Streptomyces phage VWB]
MKTTHREDWRVIITIAPQYTRIPISALGFTGLDSDLDGTLAGDPFEVTIAPRQLGDFGYASMGDRLVSDDIEGDYRRRCESMLAELLRQPHVRSGRVAVTETHTCSHCDLGWEELTADEAADHSTNVDERSIEGEPVCCGKAIEEFRRERGIPMPSYGGAA